jgi:Predicted transcriptional regulator, BolA superfamily
MHPTEIESILRAALALDELYVQGDNGHFQVIAVSALFAGMSRVKNSRQFMLR